VNLRFVVIEPAIMRSSVNLAELFHGAFMSKPIEPLHHKMTEALPEAAQPEAPTSPEPGHDPSKADVKQHNIDANNTTRKGHMVDIGRGENIAGRQGQ